MNKARMVKDPSEPTVFIIDDDEAFRDSVEELVSSVALAPSPSAHSPHENIRSKARTESHLLGTLPRTLSQMPC